MKKIKMLLLAAMIIGAGSAFTTTKVNDLLVLDEDGETFISQEAGDLKGGICDSQFSEFCTYTSPNVPNTAGPVGRYQYP